MTKYEWNLTPSNISDNNNITFVFIDYLESILEKHVPELKHLFPFRNHSITSNIHVDREWFAFFANDKNTQMPHVGSFKDKEDVLNTIIKFSCREYKYQELKQVLGQTFYDFRTFTYVGKIKDGKASWGLMHSFITEWLNDLVLPRVLELNEKAVRLAITDAPTYSPEAVTKGLVILECESTCKQGTGFFLKDVGIITCSHVLGTATKAFYPAEPHKPIDVNIDCKHDAIDLAILSLRSTFSYDFYEMGSADNLQQMEHILLSGFPNYQKGDKGFICPGIV